MGKFVNILVKLIFLIFTCALLEPRREGNLFEQSKVKISLNDNNLSISKVKKSNLS